MKKDTIIALILAFIFILAAALVARAPGKITEQDDNSQSQEHMMSDGIHMHAGFQVYKNDQLVDFSDFKYMSVKPCGEDTHVDGKGGYSKFDDIHLHDSVGDIIHLHTGDVTWSDIFTSLNYSINPSVQGYIDGEKVDAILTTRIEDLSSATFILGSVSDLQQKIDDRVPIEKITEVGSQSEDCGS